MRTIISSSNDYDVQAVYEGDVVVSVSCIGNFNTDIVCMGEYHVDEHLEKRTYAVEKKVVKTINKEATVYHCSTDEYGPTRMDKDGNPVYMTEDNGIWVGEDGELYDDNPMMQIRDDFGAMGPATWDLRYTQDIGAKKLNVFDGLRCTMDEQVDMPKARTLDLYEYMNYKGTMLMTEDLKELKLSRKDASNLWNNREEILAIFRDNHDDIGADSDKECVEAKEEFISCDINGEQDEVIASVTVNTEVSMDYMNLIGYNNEKHGHNHGVIWTAVRFNSKAAITKLNNYLGRAFDNANEQDEWELSYKEYDYLMYLIGTNGLDYRTKNSLATRNCHWKKGKFINSWDQKHYEYMRDVWVNDPKNLDYRIIDLYEPTSDMKEGFVLWVNFDQSTGKFDESSKGSKRTFKAVEYFNTLVAASKKDRAIVTIARNVRKENQNKFKYIPLYSACWNLWFKSTDEYMKHVKSGCRY